ncbi:MAG: transport protein [Parcubacteria group bacterium GW2011_GWB1_50_9]|uniref:Transport protein n=1 Tax=Candidatus Adlerbacteria bacterium GW2011_GWC1_50_9 TaxID=1618608 RepID=A0A0G1WHE0_9BACT|nr:MAG: transport protein [Parcubacteria group bacterium GW2011_GWB1_50_9]KKW18218.1 MAG: transport protein [Candidatus Adlerbacteria bacterium GW2011_GWC1_50_9]
MTLGIIFAIGAAMTWGLVYVLEQKILTEFSVMKFLFFESIFTLFISVVAALYFEKTDSLLTAKNLNILLSPSFLILIAVTFLANYFILRSVQLAGATFASMFEITFPIFVVIFGFFLLRAPIHWLTGVGAILIISGSMVVIYANKI